MIESLLPHRGDALFLREVTAHDAGSIEAVASVPIRSGYATDGRADALLAFEIAAQAAAAWAGLQRPGPVAAAATGMLVGVKELALRVADFPCDEDVRVSARLEGRAQQLANWQFTVECASTGIVASGRIAVWQDEP